MLGFTTKQEIEYIAEIYAIQFQIFYGKEVYTTFSDNLVHEEQTNQRACKMALLACCTSPVLRIY